MEVKQLEQLEQIAGIAILSLIFSSFVTVFWMIVGWQAMRSLEKLANAVELMALRNNRQNQQTDLISDD